MKIGFDAKRAFMNYSGLGNYSRSVIESLAKFFSDETYFLFTPDKNRKLFEQILVKNNILLVNPPSFLKPVWRSFSQINDWNKLKLDVFHGLSNELPFGLSKAKTKKIVTIHDVIFKKHPEFYSVIDRNIYELKTKQACRNADKIICISEQTKREVLHYFPYSENKIKVIYPALPDHITQIISINKIEEIKKRFQLPEKFILYTGTIEKRKNLLTVLKALNKLGKNALPLIAVGKKTNYLNKVKNYLNASAPNLQVSFIQNANNEELNVLYSLAHVFVYTSLIEGFGIPLIEAAAHGVPSITTKNSCMEEAAGKGALFVTAESVEETTNALLKIITDSTLHKHLSIMAIEHSLQFNNKRLAEDLMNTYRETINN